MCCSLYIKREHFNSVLVTPENGKLLSRETALCIELEALLPPLRTMLTC